VAYGGCYGGCYGGGYVVPMGTAPKATKTGEKGDKESYYREAPATIVVELPADAKLLIDDTATTSTSSRRVFVSPDLDTGREYHYTLKAEAMRDGKLVKVEKQVAVRGGETTPVTLVLPPSQVAQR
jgi:uncharacterized protein (TIGR03000 family)